MGERDIDSETIGGNGQRPPQEERRQMPRPGDRLPPPEPDQWRGDSRQTVRRDGTADGDGVTPASNRTPIPS